MQIVPLLAERGLRRAVDEKLQDSGAAVRCPSSPTGAHRLRGVFPLLAVRAVFPMLDPPVLSLAAVRLAAAGTAGATVLPVQRHDGSCRCCGTALPSCRLPVEVSRAQQEPRGVMGRERKQGCVFIVI